MANVVTGIAPAADLIALERALTAAGLPLEPLQAIEPDSGSLGAAARLAHVQIIMGTSGTGTGVPGLTSGESDPHMEPPMLSHVERLLERLGALEIPDDEVQNYIEALDAGRSVVGYFAPPAAVAEVEDVFRSSGLAKVKTF